MYFKMNRSTKRFVFFKGLFIYFVLTYVYVSQVLTLLGGVRFIAWHLLLGECRRDSMHFGECRARLGKRPVPGPTLKRSCATLVRLVGRRTNTVDIWLVFVVFPWVVVYVSKWFRIPFTMTFSSRCAFVCMIRAFSCGSVI